jgi:hypothetical protein
MLGKDTNTTEVRSATKKETATFVGYELGLLYEELNALWGLLGLELDHHEIAYPSAEISRLTFIERQIGERLEKLKGLVEEAKQVAGRLE